MRRIRIAGLEIPGEPRSPEAAPGDPQLGVRRVPYSALRSGSVTSRVSPWAWAAREWTSNDIGWDRPGKRRFGAPISAIRASTGAGRSGLQTGPGDITPLPDLWQGQARSGPVRSQRPVYVDLLPPCNAALPRGRKYPGLAGASERRRARRGLAASRRGQPFSGHSRAGLLPPLRDLLQPGRARQPGVDPCRRALLGRSGRRAGLAVRPAAAAAAADGCWSSGPDPSGLSAAYHLARRGHEVEIRDAGPEPGG